MFFKLTLKSRNEKTGPIPVSTSDRATCPNACPFKGNGCYAESFRLRMVWDKVSAGGLDATSFDGLCEQVAALPAGTLWRHNQAGDLPGKNDIIDAAAMDQLIAANVGRRGFTYTHKPMTKDNLEPVRLANAYGFTVNISANNLKHADQLAKHKLPMVVVLPRDFGDDGTHVTATPKGRKVVQCPATYRDDVTCKSCGLCQKSKGRAIVGFPAHGANKTQANTIAKG